MVAIITISIVPQFANAKKDATPVKTTQQKSETEAYPVTLPTMSLVGLTQPCDGTIDGRRSVLTKLWTAFEGTQSFEKDNAIYRKKIYVIYYNHSKENAGYSIFIGYLFNSEVKVKDQSTVVIDIPKGDYWAYDARGTSANAIIKAWDIMYYKYPNEKNNRAMEVMTLDSDNYTVQNVTLYLKK